MRKLNTRLEEKVRELKTLLLATAVAFATATPISATTVNEFKKISQVEYSEDNLYLLAHVICGEAQNCPQTEQEYVGSVVLNRVDSDRFPNTLSEVIFQSGQYACTWDGNYNKEPTETNWDVAEDLLKNGSKLPGDIVWQSAVPQGSYTYIQTEYHYYCGG